MDGVGRVMVNTEGRVIIHQDDEAILFRRIGM